MKRILVLLSVVVLMVVMLAMSVAPALARPLHQYYCTQPGWVDTIIFPYNKQYNIEQGYDCVKLPRDQWF
jgi:hypothetical protein